MPWTADDDEINGVIDANLKSSPPNPPAVNTSETVKNLFKAYWSVVRGQVEAAIEYVDLTNSSVYILEKLTEITNLKNSAETAANTANTNKNEVQALKDQAQIMLNTALSASNPLGEYNAATNIPALTAIPPTTASGAPIGSFLNITVPGNVSFAGSNFASGQAVAIGGRLIKKSETQWYYINPSDLAKQLADQNRTELDKITEDTIGVLKRTVTVPMTVVTRNSSNTIIANSATTKQSVSVQREITITGYDDAIDSNQEMFATGISSVGYKSFEFTATYLSSKSANPYIGFGFEAAGETIGILYRVDGRIGWLGTNSNSGGINTILVNDPDRALIANDIITIIITPSAINVAVQVFRNGILKSTFTITKIVTGNIVISSRGSAIYKCTIVSNKAATVIDGKISVSNTDTKTYTNSRVDPIIRASVNLLPPDFVAESSYSNSTGAILPVSTGYKRTLNLLPVLPDTYYTISGVNTPFPGNEYNSNIAEAASRVRVIAPNLSSPGVYNTITFKTSPTTTYIGINVKGNGLADTSAVSMVQIGQAASSVFETYQAAYLKGETIRGVPAGFATTADLDALKSYSDVYVSYNPTGYHSSITGSDTELFTVYTRLGQKSSYYAGFKIAHLVNAAIKQDLYKITGADLYTYNGSNMSAPGINLLNPSESEFAYSRQGAWDHTGGYHGNEKIVSVDFFTDSIKVADLTTGFTLLPCKDFWFIQKSNMLRTPPSSGETIADFVENEHGKKTWFKAGGYRTNNVLQWKEAGLTILKAYPGIVTVGLPVSAKFRIGNLGPEITTTHASQTGAQYRGNVGDREVLYYHPDNKIGVTVSSEIKRALSGPTWGIKDGVNMIISYATNNTLIYDMACMQRIWDNINYAKYYRELEGKVTTLDELWEFECQVTFFKQN